MIKTGPMINRVFLICLLLITALPAMAQESPAFVQYAVAVQKLKPKKPNVKTDAQAKNYDKYLRNSTKKGVNFAGQYVLTNWSCGTHCLQFAIIDAKTGKIFFPDKLQKVTFNSNADGLAEYKPDSRLLILNYSADAKMSAAKNTADKHFYEWTGAELREIESSFTVKNADGTKGVLKPQILPIFQPVISQVKAKSKVPVLLPANIPAPKYLPKIVPIQEGATELVLYSYVSVVNDSEYDLTIDITPDCMGRPNCNYGHIAGRKNSASEPISMEGIEYDSKKAEKVLLDKNIAGFYVPASQNAKAISGAQVFWLDGAGNQFMVSLRRAPKEDVVAMANSTINNISTIK